MIMEELHSLSKKVKKCYRGTFYYCGGEEGKITFEIDSKLKILDRRSYKVVSNFDKFIRECLEIYRKRIC
jgi:hypothetical protein